jgi:hypothetical protein
LSRGDDRLFSRLEFEWRVPLRFKDKKTKPGLLAGVVVRALLALGGAVRNARKQKFLTGASQLGEKFGLRLMNGGLYDVAKPAFTKRGLSTEQRRRTFHGDAAFLR